MIKWLYVIGCDISYFYLWIITGNSKTTEFYNFTNRTIFTVFLLYFVMYILSNLCYNACILWNQVFCIFYCFLLLLVFIFLMFFMSLMSILKHIFCCFALQHANFCIFKLWYILYVILKHIFTFSSLKISLLIVIQQRLHSIFLFDMMEVKQTWHDLAPNTLSRVKC